MRRVVIIADLHCGHRSGLTPPAWQFRADDERRSHYAEIQSYMWDWYSAAMKDLQPIDTLILNGDAIEGKGERSGGTEVFAVDPEEQVKMARVCVEAAFANKIIISYGTPYHAGVETDYEAFLAQQLNAEIHSHPFVISEGVVFDVKHKVGSSSIPHGRHTAPARERLWNVLWAERGQQPKAQIVIRSHVHYFQYCGDAEGLAITTPALQAPGSKYGARQCAGTIDVGLLSFDCSNCDYSWRSHLAGLQCAAQEAIEA